MALWRRAVPRSTRRWSHRGHRRSAKLPTWQKKCAPKPRTCVCSRSTSRRNGETAACRVRRGIGTAVSAVETWPDPDFGLHPRADEEDGDLGERVAAFGKLVNRIPALTGAMGWGAHLEISRTARSGGQTTRRIRCMGRATRLGARHRPAVQARSVRALQTLVGDDEQLAIDDAARPTMAMRRAFGPGKPMHGIS